MICTHCGLSKYLGEELNGCFCKPKVSSVCIKHTWMDLYKYLSSWDFLKEDATSVNHQEYQRKLENNRIPYWFCNDCGTIALGDDKVTILYIPESK